MHSPIQTSSIKRIAVLITCHNRREKSLACLRALFDQSLPDCVGIQVYLVDDGCTDGTGDAVRKQFPGVRVLQGDGNLYWCGGMRFAWTEAMKEDYDAYLWLNDDTILLSGAFETMLATACEVRASEGHDGIIVGSCRDPKTGKHTYGGRIKRNRRSRLPDQPRLPGDRVLPCDTMNGNLVLVPREVVTRLGNLSPEFIHTRGDVDYGLRARAKGISIWMAPNYIGECSANPAAGWTLPSMRLLDRIRIMNSPKGLPPKEWLIFTKRHTGFLWPLYWLKIYVRVLFPWLW
ncbi:MAG: glycosyltransferase family 2 protein [Sedimentisphaerales bacterium]|nr:glycosyltransferase family 2 protein [Sedimentisphaerales bacterium]